MNSKITYISKDRIKYGNEGTTHQFIILLIGVFSLFFCYYSIIQLLPIISDIQRIISTYWLGLALLSVFLIVICGFIILGFQMVTIFDREKHRIVQRVAGYLSIRRYLYKPKIWSLNELRTVIIEEVDDGETLWYSLSLQLSSGEIIPLSIGKYSGYDAKKDAEKILSFLGLSIDSIQEEKRKDYISYKS